MGSTLIFTILFVITVGFLLYMGQVLDRATDAAARQIMIGAVQKAGIGQSDFRTGTLCPALPTAFNCNNLVVNVQTVKEDVSPKGYYGLINATQTGLSIPVLSNSGSKYDPGIQSDYVYLQVIYPITILPSFMSSILSGGATYNGSPAFLAVSTAAFRNENY